MSSTANPLAPTPAWGLQGIWELLGVGFRHDQMSAARRDQNYRVGDMVRDTDGRLCDVTRSLSGGAPMPADPLLERVGG